MMQITKKCNYRCSYCSVQKEDREIEDYSGIIKKLGKLKDIWDIILIGCEPFTYGNLKDMVREIISKTNHNIVITTNFSAPPEKFIEIIDIAKERLKNLELSLHLEYVKPRVFLRKLMRLKQYSDRYNIKIGVKLVALKKDFKKRARIGRLFSKKGINFNLLPNKRFFGNTDYYSEKEKKIIRDFGQDFGFANIHFKGKICETGQRFFVIDTEGNAYSEIFYNPSKKSIGKPENKKFKIHSKAIKCPYDSCLCETPYIFGMIHGTDAQMRQLRKNFFIQAKSPSDRIIGRFGLFLKKLNPQLYYKLKKIKDGK